MPWTISTRCNLEYQKLLKEKKGHLYLVTQALFAVSRTRTLSTQDVFQILLRSFHAAHCLILEEEAMLTTLTAAVVVPTKHKGFAITVRQLDIIIVFVVTNLWVDRFPV